MKCCDLLFTFCSRQRHQAVNNNNNNLMASNKERLIWMDQPTSSVLKNPLPEAGQNEERLAMAARALERRLSWSPRRCQTKPYRSEPASVHRASVVNLSACRSLPGSLDFLSPGQQPVRTTLVTQHRSAPTTPQMSARSADPSDERRPEQPAVAKRRFLRLIAEGDVQLCKLNHSGTVIGKILSSKFLRRWETHHLFLNDAQISSKTVFHSFCSTSLDTFHRKSTIFKIQISN